MAKRNLKSFLKKAASFPPAELNNMPIARRLWKENIKSVGIEDQDLLLEFCILGEQIAGLKKQHELLNLQFTICERQLKAKNILYQEETTK
jgi:hypothetical protein